MLHYDIHICDGCGEEHPACDCPCDCEKCLTCGECSTCQPDFGCPDCNPRKSWDPPDQLDEDDLEAA